MERRRLAVIFVVTGLLFGLLMWRISPYYGASVSPSFLLFAVAVPVLPFLVLAAATLARRRFRTRYLYQLAAFIAVLVAAPNVWWYVEYGADHYKGGGVNFALGCLMIALPILVLFSLILGLALAAESSSE